MDLKLSHKLSFTVVISSVGNQEARQDTKQKSDRERRKRKENVNFTLKDLRTQNVILFVNQMLYGPESHTDKAEDIQLFSLIHGDCFQDTKVCAAQAAM